MTHYILGLDIGIASIGFAAVDLDAHTILSCGAHIFEAAENPKDGASLALPRRTKRGMRRVIGRRAQRKKAIRALLERHGFDASAIDEKPIVVATNGQPLTVWYLRQKALKEKMTDAEFVRVLFHIAKRRGFQSNRKGAELNDTEGKKALSGAIALQEAMVRSNAETIGAYLATLPKQRNGNGSYECFVTRDLLRAEVKKMFDAQRRLGQARATAELENRYSDIAFYQRPLQSSEHMVGLCFLEPGEKRAPKFSYTAEEFVLWSKLNNTRIRDKSGNERELTQDEKNRLADKAHSLSGLSYKQARKELGLSDDERFNIGYRKTKDDQDSWDKIRDATEKTAGNFVKLPGYHALREALDTGSDIDWQRWTGRDRAKLDDIARILSFYEDPAQIKAMLGLDDERCDKLLRLTGFSKTIDISVKAAGNILPFMRRGMTYDKACAEAGYDFNRRVNSGLTYVPRFDDVRNPVVNRAMAQARKVINAVIRKHGMPETIIVELARDVGKNFKDRKDIEREQKKNQEYRKDARIHAAEIMGIDADRVTGEDILKLRLWKEQEKFCMYCGAQVTTEQFLDPTATQIDHIIPYSRSWDDSYSNKTLCHTDCNQDKGNKTPFERWGETARWPALTALLGQKPSRKAEKFLAENVDGEKETRWKERNLTDTRYMARLLKNHLEQHLADENGKPIPIQTRNGQLTAHLRGAWGFPDKNRRNDRHHALDAIVLACSTQGMVQSLSNWNKYEAKAKNPKEKPRPPAPWDSFHYDAMNAVYGPKDQPGGIFVSRMPVRKVTGPAHEETIRSIRTGPDGGRQIVQRVRLTSLKPAQLEGLVNRHRKNDKLYNLLKERLDKNDGKPEKAFAEPVYMPTNDPAKKGPPIHSVRVLTSEKSGVNVNGGLASNGDMVRVDVFRKDGKNYLCPVYVHHFARKELPNKAIVAHKDEDEWLDMAEEHFLFSLYRNDLLCIQKKGGAPIFGYYVGTDRSSAGIDIRTHDNDPSFGKEGLMRGNGVQNLLRFEKYSVDYFGEKHRILKEKRLGVAQRTDPESGEAEPVEGAAEAAE